MSLRKWSLIFGVCLAGAHAFAADSSPKNSVPKKKNKVICKKGYEWQEGSCRATTSRPAEHGTASEPQANVPASHGSVPASHDSVPASHGTPSSAASCSTPAAPSNCGNFWSNYESSKFKPSIARCASPASGASGEVCSAYQSCLKSAIQSNEFCTDTVAEGSFLYNSNAARAIQHQGRSPASHSVSLGGR